MPSPLRRRHQGWRVLRAQPSTNSSTNIYSLRSSLMVQHLQSQSGLVNSEQTSTSASLSTSTSWTSPAMRSNLIQQTSWCNRHQLDTDNIKRMRVSHKRARQALRDERALPAADPRRENGSKRKYNRSPMASMRNRHFRTLPQQEYDEQVNFLVT